MNPLHGLSSWRVACALDSGWQVLIPVEAWHGCPRRRGIRHSATINKWIDHGPWQSNVGSVSGCCRTSADNHPAVRLGLSSGLIASILPKFLAVRFGLGTLFPVLFYVRAKLLAVLLYLLLARRSSRRRRTRVLSCRGLGHGERSSDSDNSSEYQGR